MEEAYAQALWKMIESGMAPKKAIQSVHQSLTARGRASLMPGIARAFERLAARKRQMDSVTLSVAREKDERSAHRSAKEALESLGVTSSDITISVDDSLIGGWRLEGKETLIDASFKKQLLTVYNRATSI